MARFEMTFFSATVNIGGRPRTEGHSLKAMHVRTLACEAPVARISSATGRDGVLTVLIASSGWFRSWGDSQWLYSWRYSDGRGAVARWPIPQSARIWGGGLAVGWGKDMWRNGDPEVAAADFIATALPKFCDPGSRLRRYHTEDPSNFTHGARMAVGSGQSSGVVGILLIGRLYSTLLQAKTLLLGLDPARCLQQANLHRFFRFSSHIFRCMALVC